MSDGGRTRVEAEIHPRLPLDAYVDALLSGDRDSAVRLTLTAFETGTPAEEVLIGLVAAGQVEVGLRWQHNRCSVAAEHRASSISDHVVRHLTDTALLTPGTPKERSLFPTLVACTENEWHVLPGEIATEILRLRGHDTTFVGPSVPADDLASFLGSDVPPVVAVSCIMPMTLFGAWRTISALRALGTHIVAGGPGFGAGGKWGRILGADAVATTFIEGADLIASLGEQPVPPPRQPAGHPAAVAEAERLALEADSLASEAATLAFERWPVLAQRVATARATRDDLTHTTHALQAAVIVDDHQVIVNYVTWFESVLAARGLPVSYVRIALSLLLEVIPETLPRTRTTARVARDACAPTGDPPGL